MVFGRTVAASAREFPFGTKLLIDGQIYVVEDRGVPSGTIDILTPTHGEALDRGRFYTTVHVWKED
jgi:3D (Asp-Asp-Asp) domain-containing protein